MSWVVWTDESLETYAGQLAYMRDRVRVVDAFLTVMSRLREAQARISELEGVVKASKK